MKYRAEIDGLRAIAVLSVVIYHSEVVILGNQLLAGGFLGVDIFFVISGYLITSIINSKISGGDFSYLDFYDRRFRRLLPAFISVTLASSALGYFLLTADRLQEFSGSVVAATLFVSNIFFWGLDDYTAAPSKLMPFLHTWSLGVEEQFYLIMPPLLWAVYKFFRLRAREVIALVVLLSLGLAIYYSFADSRSGFFMIFTRFWELGVGSLIALYGLRARADDTTGGGGWLGAALSLIGLGLILSSVVLMNDSLRHPSERTLLAVLGTALIIIYARPSELVGRTLSLYPMRQIGLLSYSFYLWHWPIIVFSKYQTSLSLPLYVWALISLLFAAVSYYLVERPLRYGSRRVSYGFIGLGTAAILIFHGYSWVSNGIPSRLGDSAPRIVAMHAEVGGPRGNAIRIPDCHLINQSTNISASCNSISEERTNVVVVGDSLGADLFISLRSAYEDYNFLQFTGAGCSFYREDLLRIRSRCYYVWNNLFDFIDLNRPNVDIVIMHGRAIQRSQWDLVADRIGSIPVLVVLPRAEITPNPRGTLETYDWQFAPEVDNVVANQIYDLTLENLGIEDVRAAATDLGFATLDISDLIFPDGYIEMFAEDGKLNFVDYAHWSVEFGQEIGRRIRDANADLISDLMPVRSVEREAFDGSQVLAQGSRQLLTRLQAPAGLNLEIADDRDAVVLSGAPETRDSSRRTSGAYLTINSSIERELSEATVEVVVVARSAEGAGLSVAFSTNDRGNSGWHDFALSTKFAPVAFTYEVPALVTGRGDYIGLIPNNGSVEISEVSIRVVQ